MQHKYSKIRQNYKQNTKNKINRAKKQNFKIIEGNNIDLLYGFFEESVFLKNGVSSQAKQTLKILFKILIEKDLTKLVYIQNSKGKIVSGIMLIKSESFYQKNNQNYSSTKWIYLFNAATKENSQKNESRRWFLDKFIQEKSNQEKEPIGNVSKILDFESAQEKEIARFNTSFGSEEKLFFVLDYNKLPFYVKQVQKIILLIKQFINK